jgi:hypothetical protein
MMFRIRVFTPAVFEPNGSAHAGAALTAGNTRLHFRVDLRFWQIVDYERQWAAGVARLAGGAESSALMSAYTGPDGNRHTMWALWRTGGHIYIQPHCVVAADLDAPFDPRSPYDHVGAHIPASANALPLLEWRVDFEYLLASSFGIRWPLAQ